MHDEELTLGVEQCVLGGLLMEPALMDDIRGGSDLFVDPDNRLIFGEMRKTWEARKQLDFVTLIHDMRDRGTAKRIRRGVRYIVHLELECGLTVPMPTHVDILRRYAAKRELQSAMDEAALVTSHGTDSIPGAVSKLRQQLDGIEDSDDSTIHTIGDLMLLEDIGPSRTISTGFHDLDRVILGWTPGTLVLIAARPSIGKSALGLSIAIKAAQANHGVAFVSSEMAKEQVRDRLVSAQSGVEHFAIREGRIDPGDRDIENAKAELYDLPFVIDDESRAYPMTARALVAKTRRKGDNCELVIVDYLQRLDPDWKEKGRNREQEVAMIARTLQKDARRLDVTVIALAQLNRRTATTGSNPKPQLSDLRESGGLEADADVVLLLWHKDPDDFKSDIATVNVNIAKNRHGRCGDIEMQFDKAHQRFT